jgi:aspartate kinase
MDKPGIAANLFQPLAEADISVDVIVQNTSSKGYTDLTFTVKRTDLNNAIEVVNSVAETLGSRGISSTDNLAKVSIIGTGMRDAPGYASKMFSTLATANINIEMITTSEIRITCIIDSKHVEKATKVIHKAFELANSE